MVAALSALSLVKSLSRGSMILKNFSSSWISVAVSGGIFQADRKCCSIWPRGSPGYRRRCKKHRHMIMSVHLHEKSHEIWKICQFLYCIPSRFAPARKTPGVEPVEEGFGGRTPPIVDCDLLYPLQNRSKWHRAAADTLLDNQINLTTMGNSYIELFTNSIRAKMFKFRR